MMSMIKISSYLFKLSLLGFGGGSCITERMYSDLVTNKKELTHDEFQDFRALSLCTPGATCVNMATTLGHSKMGLFGALIASLSILAPSILNAIILNVFDITVNPIVFRNIQVAVCAILTVNIYRIIRTELGRIRWKK